MKMLGIAGRDVNNGSFRIMYECECGYVGTTRKSRFKENGKCRRCTVLSCRIEHNKYQFLGDIVKICISTGKFPDCYCFIDRADFEKVIDGKGRWFAANYSKGGTIYAVRNLRNIKMHRHILGASRNETVDHLDGNGLNNSRSNIRLTTQQQNTCNRVIQKNNTSGVNGVSKTKSGRFIVNATVLGNRFCLGTYKTLKEATAIRKNFDKKNGFTGRHGSER